MNNKLIKDIDVLKLSVADLREQLRSLVEVMTDMYKLLKNEMEISNIFVKALKEFTQENNNLQGEIPPQ